MHGKKHQIRLKTLLLNNKELWNALETCIYFEKCNSLVCSQPGKQSLVMH